MFPKPDGVPEEHREYYSSGEKHCLLVASSNPFSLPRPVWLPVIKDGGSMSVQTEWCLVDVEDVAKLFPKVHRYTIGLKIQLYSFLLYCFYLFIDLFIYVTYFVLELESR